MTNKDSIQQKHLGIILDYPSEVYTSHKCTTVTAEAICEAMRFIGKSKMVYNEKTDQWVFKTLLRSTDEMKELFLNQKAK
jgi:hypothetical protein